MNKRVIAGINLRYYPYYVCIQGRIDLWIFIISNSLILSLNTISKKRRMTSEQVDEYKAEWTEIYKIKFIYYFEIITQKQRTFS